MNKFLTITFFVASYIFFFMFGFMFINILSKISFVVYTNDNTNDTDCINLSLPDTMLCLKDKTNPIYNISNVGKVMTEQQFLKEGGVCKHYSDWYKDKAKELGFDAKTIVFSIDKKEYHQVTIVFNSEGYCFADQQLIKCVQYYPI